MLSDAVMSRGTFANIRLVNKFLGGKAGPKTVHFPSMSGDGEGGVMDIYDAAELYRQSATPLIVLAGKDYGSGSSRDWAAKGPYLLVSWRTNLCLHCLQLIWCCFRASKPS